MAGYGGHAAHAGKSGGMHDMKGHDDGKLTSIKAPPLNMDKGGKSRGGKSGTHAKHHAGGHHLHGASHMRAHR